MNKLTDKMNLVYLKALKALYLTFKEYHIELDQKVSSDTFLIIVEGKDLFESDLLTADLLKKIIEDDFQ